MRAGRAKSQGYGFSDVRRDAFVYAQTMFDRDQLRGGALRVPSQWRAEYMSLASLPEHHAAAHGAHKLQITYDDCKLRFPGWRRDVPLREPSCARAGPLPERPPLCPEAGHHRSSRLHSVSDSPHCMLSAASGARRRWPA